MLYSVAVMFSEAQPIVKIVHTHIPTHSDASDRKYCASKMTVVSEVISVHLKNQKIFTNK